MRIGINFTQEYLDLLEAEADLNRMTVRDVVLKAVRCYFVGREIHVLEKAARLEALRARVHGNEQGEK